MRLHRFYIDHAIMDEKIKVADPRLLHQWRNVFRYMIGAQVIIFCGDGYDYKCMIAEMGNKTAALTIVSRKKSLIPLREVALVQALIKKDHMEWIIEKATELGVSKIFPVISERSEKKLLNMDRARKIAIEAAEQSGRGTVTEITEPINLAEFLEGEVVDHYQSKIAFHTDADMFQLTDASDSTIIFIGPEGGWTDQEVELFREKGIGRRKLGELTLRAETAAIATLSVVGLV